MLGLCFSYDKRAQTRNEWSYLIDWFAVSHAWEYGKPDELDGYPKTVGVTSSADLPDSNLVVLSPPEARRLRGETCIYDFIHPKDAIYFIGANNVQMSESPMLLGKEYESVYIPTEKYELYAAYAATIVLYDRKRKAWGR